jgi:hypothetical protein
MSQPIDSEKNPSATAHVEVFTTVGEGRRPDHGPIDSENRDGAEKRLLRKLDVRVVPMIMIIYIMNYIDVRLVIRVIVL